MIFLTKVLFCFLLFLINLSDAKLAVKTPNNLWQKFDQSILSLFFFFIFSKANGIDYVVLTPQNKITYKRAFIGNLVLANPDNGCDSIQPIQSVGDETIDNPILLVDSEKCYYPQKVKNAEVAGAKMLILILRNDIPINHPAIKQMRNHFPFYNIEKQQLLIPA